MSFTSKICRKVWTGDCNISLIIFDKNSCKMFSNTHKTMIFFYAEDNTNEASLTLPRLGKIDWQNQIKYAVRDGFDHGSFDFASFEMEIFILFFFFLFFFENCRKEHYVKSIRIRSFPGLFSHIRAEYGEILGI